MEGLVMSFLKNKIVGDRIIIPIAGAAGSGKTHGVMLPFSNLASDIACIIPCATIWNPYHVQSLGPVQYPDEQCPQDQWFRSSRLPQFNPNPIASKPIRYQSIYSSMKTFKRFSTPLQRMLAGLASCDTTLNGPLSEDLLSRDSYYSYLLSYFQAFFAKYSYVFLDSMENIFQTDRVLAEKGEDLAPIKLLGDIEPLFLNSDSLIFTSSRLSAKNWDVIVGEAQGGVFVVSFSSIMVVLPWERHVVLFTRPSNEKLSALTLFIISLISADRPTDFTLDAFDDTFPGCINFDPPPLEELIDKSRHERLSAYDAVTELKKLMTAKAIGLSTTSKEVIASIHSVRSAMMYRIPQTPPLDLDSPRGREI